MTSNYEILPAGSGEKTNPIQTQLKPKQTQFNPIQSQFKANSKPISKTKNESFCVDKDPDNYIRNTTRGFYHPKGCQFVETATTNAFALVRSLMMIFDELLADFTTLKGVPAGLSVPLFYLRICGDRLALSQLMYILLSPRLLKIPALTSAYI
jgi:hypothetical protein